MNELETNAVELILPLMTVNVISDEMIANLTMRQPNEGVRFNIDDLTEALARKNVKHGLIHSALRSVVQGTQYGKSIVVARGQAPVDGSDGFYTTKFDTKRPKEPTLLANNSFNFEKLDFFQMVDKNDILYEYTAPTFGKFGNTVTGKLLHPKRGEEAASPAFGEGCTLDNEKNVRAAYTGHLYYIDEVPVLTPLCKIEGKLNDLARTVDVIGDIAIMDEIQAGSTLKATGDIVIYGSAASCNISAGGRVFICTGTQGSEDNRFQIYGRKGVWGRFFESLTIRSDGNIYTNHLVRCTVSCEGTVYVAGGKGTILGGTVRACRGVCATVIGNTSETYTRVEMGIFKDKLTEYQELLSSKAQYEQQMASLISGINGFKAALKKSDDELALDPRFSKLKEAYDSLKFAYMETQTQLNHLSQIISSSHEPSITVTGVVFPNVELVCDDMILNVDKMMRRRKFLKGEEGIEATIATS